MPHWFFRHHPATMMAMVLLTTLSDAAEIYIDQIGYLPEGRKIAYVSQKADSFYVLQASDRAIVHRGRLQLKSANDAATGMALYVADFSAWQQPGRYYVHVPGMGDSYPFSICDTVYAPVFAQALKGFFYQRCGTALSPAYAGVYSHPACHGNDGFYHSSTGLTGRRVATGGWHDAGDYGKYVVNAGITVETLLLAWESFPPVFASDHIGIPESHNGLPDILDEVRWELEWLLKMPSDDGGVHHKLTREQFAGFIMPQMDQEKRYLYAISSTATGNFAAMMARAYRVFRPYDASFADTCLVAAKKAWDFLQAHPHIVPDGGFHNPSGTATGEYGDGQDADERLLAAAELFESTGEDVYHNYFLAQYEKPGLFTQEMSWPYVAPLAHLTYLYSRQSQASQTIKMQLQTALLAFAQKMLNDHERSGFAVLLQPGEYVWGSNAVALNKGILMLFAYQQSKQISYLQIALDQLHYILGANAHNLCFVTGLGSWSPRNIHHRPSIADGVPLPVPGLLAGGPNQYLNDAVLKNKFNSQTPPALCYIDHRDSYASNEICINWNAPLVFLAGYFAATPSSHIGRQDDATMSPDHLCLFPNFPNPFNSVTTMRYYLPQEGEVTISVKDILGREVTLFHRVKQMAGEHEVIWHADATSGVYYWQLTAVLPTGPEIRQQKMVLLK